MGPAIEQESVARHQRLTAFGLRKPDGQALALKCRRDVKFALFCPLFITGINSEWA
jgi:hypothetical protein